MFRVQRECSRDVFFSLSRTRTGRRETLGKRLIIAEILLLCDIWWIVIFEVPLHNGGHVNAHGG